MRLIKGFDGLRGLSIITVLLTHLGVIDKVIAYDNGLRLSYLVQGMTGVTLFFTISGFLITLLFLYEQRETGSISIKNFYIRRFLRLLPPLLIFFTVVAYLTFDEKIPGTALGLVTSIFYLYNFMPRAKFTGELTHTWSLAVEEQFYLIWPWVIIFIRQAKKILAIIFILIVTCFLFAYFAPSINVHNDAGEIVPLTSKYFVGRWFIPAVAPIMTGALFAYVSFYYPDFFKNKTTKYASAVGALFLYLAPLWMPEEILGLTNFVQAGGFGLLMMFIYTHQNNILTRVLSFRPLAFIGKISYGIYVYQGLFLRTGPNGTLWIQKFPQNILLTFLIAVISYYLVEKPFLKLKDKFRRPDAVPIPVSAEKPVADN